jgi:hypothetical protein
MGLGSKRKVESLRDIIETKMPSTILLQEMKLEESEAIQAGKKSFKNDKGLTMISSGASGGTMTLWDITKVEEEVSYLSWH